MHITNWEINKDSINFIRCNGINEKPENSKWSLPFFFNYLNKIGINSKKVQKDLEDVTLKAIISGMIKIRENNNFNFPESNYELLGVDLILDENLKPYVVEINVSPGMSALDSELDHYIKLELMMDVLNISRIIDCNSKEENPLPILNKLNKYRNISLNKNRKFNVENGLINPLDNPIFLDYLIIRTYLDEKNRKRFFNKVYPKKNNLNYFKNCFNKYTYEDIILINWIKLSKIEKQNFLKNNFQNYLIELENLKNFKENICKI